MLKRYAYLAEGNNKFISFVRLGLIFGRKWSYNPVDPKNEADGNSSSPEDSDRTFLD